VSAKVNRAAVAIKMLLPEWRKHEAALSLSAGESAALIICLHDAIGALRPFSGRAALANGPYLGDGISLCPFAVDILAGGSVDVRGAVVTFERSSPRPPAAQQRGIIIAMFLHNIIVRWAM